MNEKWQNSVGKFFKVQSSVQVFGIFFQSINQSMESIKDEKKTGYIICIFWMESIEFQYEILLGKILF